MAVAEPPRASLFGAPKCSKCGLSAYPNESMSYDALVYHKNCFRCTTCG
jgi:hypothetical protein